MENNNQNISQVSEIKEIKKTIKRNRLMIIVLVLLFLSIGGIFYFLTIYQQEEITVVEEITQKKDDVLTEIEEEFTNRIFFKKDGGIYSYNVETEEILKWIEGDVEDFYEIDEEHIGFSVRDSSGIYQIKTFNIKTKKETILLEIKGEHRNFLDLITFHSPTKFAYIIANFDSAYYQFFLYDNFETNKILEKEIMHSGGGGGYDFIYRTLLYRKKFEFSSDGNYILYYSPLNYFTNPNSSDVNMYVYNIKNKYEYIIPEVLTPQWFDGNNIIYSASKTDKEGNKYFAYELNIYNLNTQKIESLNSSINGILPEPLNDQNKLLYNVSKEEPNLFLYDLDSQQNIQLVENAWEGRWINSTKILFNQLGFFEGSNSNNSYSEDLLIFDLKNNKTIELPKEVKEGIVNVNL